MENQQQWELLPQEFNFEAAFASDRVSRVRLEYLKPMRWRVCEASHDQPAAWRIVVEGGIKVVIEWVRRMVRDGRPEIPERLDLSIHHDWTMMVHEVRPSAVWIGTWKDCEYEEAGRVCPGLDCDRCDAPPAMIFAEPTSGQEVVVWVLRFGMDAWMHERCVTYGGLRSVEEVVETVWMITDGSVEPNMSNIRCLFDRIADDVVAVARAMVGGSGCSGTSEPYELL